PIAVTLISRKARCRGGQPLVSEGALPVGLGVLAETGCGVHACGSAAKEEVEDRRFAAVGAAEQRQMDRIAHEPAGEERGTNPHTQLGCHIWLDRLLDRVVLPQRISLLEPQRTLERRDMAITSAPRIVMYT